MGLSLTPITHISASPLFDPGRSVFPSPVLTLAYSLGRLPIAGEAQVLTHLHPYPQWFTPDSVSMPVLRPSMSGTSETAKYPEPPSRIVRFRVNGSQMRMLGGDQSGSVQGSS